VTTREAAVRPRQGMTRRRAPRACQDGYRRRRHRRCRNDRPASRSRLAGHHTTSWLLARDRQRAADRARDSRVSPITPALTILPSADPRRDARRSPCAVPWVDGGEAAGGARTERRRAWHSPARGAHQSQRSGSICWAGQPMCTWPGTLPDSATAGQRDLFYFYRGLRVSPAISACVCASIQVIVKKRMSSSASLGKPQ
jgi:hypothetical protein